MANEIPVHKIGATTKVAAADLSAAQYRAVKIDAAGKIALAGDGEQVAGILQNKPKAGEVCEVMALGETPAVAGAAVTAGDKIASDATGKLVLATTGEFIVGQAEESAVLDEQFTLLLLPGGRAA